jgi:tRNA (cytidine32/guanosine34-2'-O)-methyltransferase
MGLLSKDKRDIFYRKAKEEGYRARSAYKLIQIDERFKILEGVERVVDLCAAPGSWSQVLSNALVKKQQIYFEFKTETDSDDDRTLPELEIVNKIGLLPGQSVSGLADTTMTAAEKVDGTTTHTTTQTTTTASPLEAIPPPSKKKSSSPKIVAVDLQEMAPIEGVTILQGDITSTKTAQEILEICGNVKVDLVICDGAPDVTGLHDLDEFIQFQLLLAAFNIAAVLLKCGGNFVAKIFRGENVDLMYAKFELFFEHVFIAKPRASRNSSTEAFVVCLGFKIPEGFDCSTLMTSAPTTVYSDIPNPINRKLVPFIQCGDLNGFDSDMNYTDVKEFVNVVQPPIKPAYGEALDLKRGNKFPGLEK